MLARPLRRVVACAVVALVAVTTLTRPAAGDDLLAVHLQLPAPGATVSGVTDVRLLVSDVAGRELTQARVTVGTQTLTVPLAPHECEPVCTKTGSLDTVPLPDGPATATLSVANAAGEVARESFAVKIGNDPLVHVSAADGSGLLTADRTLTVYAYPVPRGGAIITGVRWLDGPRSTAFRAPASGVATDPWTTTIDTTSLPEGSYLGSVVATDSRGRTTAPRQVDYGVVRSMTVTGPVLTGTVDDWQLEQISIRFAHAAGVRDAYPQLVTTTLDGVEVSRDTRPELLSVDQAYANGIVDTGAGARVAPGPHRMSVTVVDTRGLSRTLGYSFSVRRTLEAAWTAGAGATVLSGDRLTLSARVRVAGVQITGCFLDVDGRPEEPPACPPTGAGERDLTSTVVIGSGYRTEHQVKLVIQPDHGQPVVLRTTVLELPRLAGRLDPAGGALPGTPFALTGTVDGAGGQPVSVVLQRRSRGEKAWRWVTGTTSRPDGSVAFRVTAARTADYRLVTRPRTGSWGGKAGPIVTVRLGSSTTLTKAPTSAQAGQTITVVGITKPGFGRGTVALLARVANSEDWVERGRVRSDDDGRVVLTTQQYAASRYKLVRESSQEAYGSSSSEVVVAMK